MNPFHIGLIIGFVIGVISTIVLYFYLLYHYEEVDLHHTPIPTADKEAQN